MPDVKERMDSLEAKELNPLTLKHLVENLENKLGLSRAKLSSNWGWTLL